MAPAKTDRIDDLKPALLSRPVEWFLAEHLRHRQFCGLVRVLADAPAFDGEQITRVVEFLKHDLTLHVIDEEEDLFPLLRRRALPEDEIEPALGRLSAEHKADLVQAHRVRERLEACLDEQQAPSADPDVARAMRDFADQELRHLALENAVVLPIARLRLSGRDLAGLSSRLAARRGLVVRAEAT